jgi:hypothetical protein
MIELKDLLSKWSNLLEKGEGKKKIVREAIFAATGIDIKTEDIEFKGGSVYLNIKPIYKNQIFLKNEEINKNLETYLGDKKPERIN